MSIKPKPGQFGNDIHRLLQAAESGQRADILAYSSGHLGARSLLQSKPCDETKQPFWSTSEKQRDTLKPLTPRKRQTKAVKNNIKDCLAEVTTDFASLSIDSALAKDHLSDFSFDAVPREDVCLNKTVFPIRKPLPKILPKSVAPKKSQTRIKQHKFDKVGLSKEDQIKISQVLVKHNVWTGTNAAEIHERKLEKELQKLSTQSWPSRDQLSVFSDVFDDVCESSPVFGRILRKIKIDYDLYVNHMMSTLQTMASHDSLKRPAMASTQTLEDKEKEVRVLEEEAREALEENRRLRHELQNVRAHTSPGDKKINDPSLSEEDSETAVGCDTSVQSKRRQVLNVWTEIQQLEEDIQEKLVSTDTTTAIQRCVKALKTEIMKLIISNNQLEITNKDLENNINTILNREKISKAIKKLLWDEIQCNL